MFDRLQEGDKQIYNVSTGDSNGNLSLARKYYNTFMIIKLMCTVLYGALSKYMYKNRFQFRILQRRNKVLQ